MAALASSPASPFPSVVSLGEEPWDRKIVVAFARLERKGTMKYRVLIEQDEDGVFVAQVPSLPGCISQGMTRGETLSNVQEAIEVYLESLKAHDEPIPPPIEEELVEVAV
jgi:predicted RNase H-like HicB family nuclease